MRFGDDVDVLLRERAQVLVREEDALAPERVARRQLGAEDGVGDARLQVLHRDALQGLHQRGMAEAEAEELRHGVDLRPDELLERRDRAERAALPVGELGVVARHDPRRRPLEDAERPDLRLDLRDELDRGGARPDDRDLLAGQVHAMVPACRVERGPLEGVEAPQARDRRLAERARGRHDDVGRDEALRGHDAPALRVVVPGEALDRVLEAQVREDPVMARAVAQVREDLRLRRERPAPVGVRGERERIEMRGHVARAPGVRVVAPGAAHVAGLLQDDEVVHPLLLQANGGTQAAEAAADDRDVHVGQVVVGHSALPGMTSCRPWPAAVPTGTNRVWYHPVPNASPPSSGAACGL